MVRLAFLGVVALAVFLLIALPAASAIPLLEPASFEIEVEAEDNLDPVPPGSGVWVALAATVKTTGAMVCGLTPIVPMFHLKVSGEDPEAGFTGAVVPSTVTRAMAGGPVWYPPIEQGEAEITAHFFAYVAEHTSPLHPEHTYRVSVEFDGEPLEGCTALEWAAAAAEVSITIQVDHAGAAAAPAPASQATTEARLEAYSPAPAGIAFVLLAAGLVPIARRRGAS